MDAPCLHVCGDRTYALELADRLFAFDPGYDGAGGPTLRGIARLAEGTGKPLAHLAVSHGHYDHAENLPLFLEAARRRPDLFDFEVIAHANAGIVAPRLRAVAEPGRLNLPGATVELLSTPGHTARLGDLSLRFPEAGLLFAGDLVQPQGATYEACDYQTPVSNHARPDLAAASLAALRELPFERLLMGHDGVVLDRASGLNAIDVTLRTLERTDLLSARLHAAHPDLDAESLMERVFDAVAAERGMAPSAVERRKVEGHAGRVARCGEGSFYRLYDLPTIRWFVKRFR